MVARQPGAPRRLAHDLLLRRGGLRLLPRHARLLLLFGLVLGDGRRGDGGGRGGTRRVVEVELILESSRSDSSDSSSAGGLLHLLVFAQGTFFAHAHLELAFLVVLVVVEVALSLGGSLGGVVLVELGVALGVAEGGVLRGRGALLAELELLLAGKLGVVVVLQLVVRGFWWAVGLARVDGASRETSSSTSAPPLASAWCLVRLPRALKTSSSSSSSSAATATGSIVASMATGTSSAGAASTGAITSAALIFQSAPPRLKKASCSQSNADDEPTRSKSDAPRLLRRSIATTSIVLAACAIR